MDKMDKMAAARAAKKGRPSTKHKLTRKEAMDAKCRECVGMGADGKVPAGMYDSIRDCTSTVCPIHEWRPYQC